MSRSILAGMTSLLIIAATAAGADISSGCKPMPAAPTPEVPSQATLIKQGRPVLVFVGASPRSVRGVEAYGVSGYGSEKGPAILAIAPVNGALYQVRLSANVDDDTIRNAIVTLENYHLQLCPNGRCPTPR